MRGGGGEGRGLMVFFFLMGGKGGDVVKNFHDEEWSHEGGWGQLNLSQTSAILLPRHRTTCRGGGLLKSGDGFAKQVGFHI